MEPERAAPAAALLHAARLAELLPREDLCAQVAGSRFVIGRHGEKHGAFISGRPMAAVVLRRGVAENQVGLGQEVQDWDQWRGKDTWTFSGPTPC